MMSNSKRCATFRLACVATLWQEKLLKASQSIEIHHHFAGHMKKKNQHFCFGFSKQRGCGII